MKENALRLLAGKSSWEDLSALIGSQGWSMLAHLPKLSQAQKLIALALVQHHDIQHVLDDAGLCGAPGLPGVKAFWRKFAMRLVSIEPYAQAYREFLDADYRSNEQLGFSSLAKGWITKSRPEDRAIYESGRLPLEHLKLRSRMKCLHTFIQELIAFMV
jgi:hypothetical protein